MTVPGSYLGGGRHQFRTAEIHARIGVVAVLRLLLDPFPVGNIHRQLIVFLRCLSVRVVLRQDGLRTVSLLLQPLPRHSAPGKGVVTVHARHVVVVRRQPLMEIDELHFPVIVEILQAKVDFRARIQFGTQPPCAFRHDVPGPVRQPRPRELGVDLALPRTVKDRRRHAEANPVGGPTQVVLQDLAQVDAALDSDWIQDDIHGSPVRQVRHVLNRDHLRNNALVAVPPGHLVAFS